jgi:predicted ATP-dependent serine protease
MYSIKTHLLSALRSSQVIILSAGPGTGKSTQIAQYLVDYRDALCWDHSVAYVSTSASMRSLADHIALQMNEPLTTFHSFRYKIGVSDGSRPVLE